MARVKKRISIVFVDDAPPPAELIEGLVRAERGLQVLSVSAELEALDRTVRETRPDVVLLNLARNSRDRLRFAGALHRAAPELPVVVMGLAPRREDVQGLVRAGVAGFIMADAPFAVYLRTILLVARGDRVLPPDLTHGLFIQLRRRYRAPQSPPVLPSLRLSVLQARS
jgi:DNA-binding NarL/FixJ family response regulator